MYIQDLIKACQAKLKYKYYKGWITFERKSYRDGVWNEQRTIQSKERMENHPNERIFKVIAFKKKYSLRCITCNGKYCSILNKWLGAHCSGGSREGLPPSPPPLPAIKYPMKMKLFGISETKLFHFHGIFKINEIKSAKRTPTHFRNPWSSPAPGNFAHLNDLNIRSFALWFSAFS